jgi:periplasmic copper chaperone A
MKSFKYLAAAGAMALAVPAFAAEGITISDAYARASTAMSMSGAAFMVIENHTDADDRLVSASSEVAERVELHTHIETDGVMRMVEVEEGFVIPAGGSHVLQRGGDHVMFLGLREAFEHGESISVTLTFETAGDIVIEIPIDLERGVDHGMQHGSGHGMQHGSGHGMQHGHDQAAGQ